MEIKEDMYNDEGDSRPSPDDIQSQAGTKRRWASLRKGDLDIGRQTPPDQGQAEAEKPDQIYSKKSKDFLTLNLQKYYIPREDRELLQRVSSSTLEAVAAAGLEAYLAQLKADIANRRNSSEMEIIFPDPAETISGADEVRRKEELARLSYRKIVKLPTEIDIENRPIDKDNG